MTIEQFKQALLKSIFDGEAAAEYKLTETDWDKIHEISKERYQSREWNYGKSPRCNFIQARRFEGVGTIEIRLDIERGSISAAKIYGDFFGVGDVRELEELLTGIAYEKKAVEAALRDLDIRRYLGSLNLEDFLALIFHG